MTGEGDEDRGGRTGADGAARDKVARDGAAQDRRARLDAALRANLRRRKAQVRDAEPVQDARGPGTPDDPVDATGDGAP